MNESIKHALKLSEMKMKEQCSKLIRIVDPEFDLKNGTKQTLPTLNL